jgi:hypothetical protein
MAQLHLRVLSALATTHRARADWLDLVDVASPALAID